MGVTTTMQIDLTRAVSRLDHRYRRWYYSMTDEQRAALEAAYRRHVAACGNIGMRPEPNFLAEHIYNLRHWPELYREAV